MKKLDLQKIRTLPVLLSLTAVALTGLIRGEADDVQESSSAFSAAELNADLDSFESAPVYDLSDVSPEEARALRERESSMAIEEFDEAAPDSGDQAKPAKGKAPPAKTKGKAPAKGKKKPAAKKRRVREINPPRFSYTAEGGLKTAWPKCSLFMDAEGEYGSYGRIVTEYLGTQAVGDVLLSDQIVGMESAPQVCPKWSSFDEETKKKFWVWTMASIAAIESQCDTNVKDKRDVTGNYTFGMYQLERSDKLRFANRKLAPHCMLPLKDVRKPLGSIRCAMDMLITQLIDQKNDVGNFDGRIYPGPGMKISTYFNEFHHAYGGYIGQLMRQFEPCR